MRVRVHAHARRCSVRVCVRVVYVCVCVFMCAAPRAGSAPLRCPKCTDASTLGSAARPPWRFASGPAPAPQLRSNLWSFAPAPWAQPRGPPLAFCVRADALRATCCMYVQVCVHVCARVLVMDLKRRKGNDLNFSGNFCSGVVPKTSRGPHTSRFPHDASPTHSLNASHYT